MERKRYKVYDQFLNWTFVGPAIAAIAILSSLVAFGCAKAYKKHKASSAASVECKDLATGT